jgi:hypothetical protein
MKKKVCMYVCVSVKGQKKRGIGLTVIRGEGLKVKGQKMEVRGQNEKSIRWRFIKFRSMATLQSDSLMLGVQPITSFCHLAPAL